MPWLSRPQMTDICNNVIKSVNKPSSLPFFAVYSVFTGWAKPKQSSQQPSSTAVPGKQAGVWEEGFCYRWTELAWLLTPVSFEYEQSLQPRYLQKEKSSHRNKMTSLDPSQYICLFHNCCWICMLLCSGIHSCWMMLLGNSVYVC